MVNAKILSIHVIHTMFEKKIYNIKYKTYNIKYNTHICKYSTHTIKNNAHNFI